MPGSLELMAAAWRAILGSSTTSGGASASSLAAAAADLAAGRRILEQIQLALAQAFRKRGAHALSAAEIAPIKALCDELQPAHFQLRVPEAQQLEASAGPKQSRVRYQHIWEDDKVSMGIFILPPGASIPLHDHPEMSVISRVLYGSLHVRSCDLVPAVADAAGLLTSADRVSSSAAGPAVPLVARVCADEEISAPHTTELLPDRGNLHEFVAGGALGCAIFDILTPPYEPDDGRDCTYYRVLGDWPRAAASGASESPPVVALEVFDPEHFAVVSEAYLGPPLAVLPPTAAAAASPSESATSSSSECAQEEEAASSLSS